VLLLNECLLL